MLHLGGVTKRKFTFNIIEIDVHPQRFGQNAQLRADMAVADNTELFAARFKAADRQFVPHAAVRFGVRFRDAAQHQQQLANDQFGNGAGVRKRGVKDGDAAFCRRVQIDLVSTDAEAANGDQLFCGSENLFRQVSTGAQANEMGITD